MVDTHEFLILYNGNEIEKLVEFNDDIHTSDEIVSYLVNYSQKGLSAKFEVNGVI